MDQEFAIRIAVDADDVRQALVRRCGMGMIGPETLGACAIAAQLGRIVALLQDLRDVASQVDRS